MTPEHLGLFDTPPSRVEYRIGIVVVAILLAGVLIVLPVRDINVGEIPTFVPAVGSMLLVSELIVATLLYSQAAVSGSRALTALAASYIFNGMLLIPHAMTFPGVVTEHGLLGAGVNTTAWLAAIRRIAFPVAVAVYAGLDTPDARLRSWSVHPKALVGMSLAAAVGLAAAATALTTIGHDLLPSIYYDRVHLVPATLLALSLVVIALTFLAMGMLLRRERSVLNLWLFVALCAWLLHSLLNLSLAARFTIGWYGLYIMMFLSTVVVMVALVAEANKLYERLAISVAARNREREDRLMSMDIMAGSMSHEAGQPLSAAMLNMSAALNWLDGQKSDVRKAAESLRAAMDAGHRTFDVIKSVRTSSGEKAGRAVEFDFNELLRETAETMRIEFRRKRAAMHLDLDDDLPPVRGDRAQMGRVVVNLVTNALEALGPTRRGRARAVSIRSRRADDGSVLVEIVDTGVGLPAESYERIFEPMFTTKRAGAGLGLWLCRSVVEHHAGRLWAEEAPGGGAMLRMQIPRSGVAIRH